MEAHVRKQLANVATEPESEQKPESEKLPLTDLANVKTMGDLAGVIKEGDMNTLAKLNGHTRRLNQICDGISNVQNRLANLETLMEAQEMSNVTVLDRLAKVCIALVAFVAKFGTKKDEAEAKDEVEA